jgi:cell division transport system permease protein
VAREFQRHFLLLGLKGGLGGALVAVILFGLVGLMMRAVGTPADGNEVSALFGSFTVGPDGYFGALGLAIVIAVLTAVTSRLTVFRYLAEVR